MDQQQPRSPRIVSIEWGRIEAERLGAGKDLKLYPRGGREWDWAETGTRHSPGIQPADVEDLLTHGASVVVLSRGMDQVLQVDPATLAYLEQRSVVVHVAETREAAEIYNKLAEDSPVGGLFHSTADPVPVPARGHPANRRLPSNAMSITPGSGLAKLSAQPIKMLPESRISQRGGCNSCCHGACTSVARPSIPAGTSATRVTIPAFHVLRSGPWPPARRACRRARWRRAMLSASYEPASSTRKQNSAATEIGSGAARGPAASYGA